jgi:hypothetical protein
LTTTFWNEIILDEIIKKHIQSQNSSSRHGVGPSSGRTGPLLHPLVILPRIDRSSRISTFPSSTASISGPFMSTIMRVERIVLHQQRIVLHVFVLRSSRHESFLQNEP